MTVRSRTWQRETNSTSAVCDGNLSSACRRISGTDWWAVSSVEEIGQMCVM